MLDAYLICYFTSNCVDMYTLLYALVIHTYHLLQKKQLSKNPSTNKKITPNWTNDSIWVVKIVPVEKLSTNSFIVSFAFTEKYNFALSFKLPNY